MSSMKQPYMLEGNISVKAALLAKRRPFYKLIVDIKKRDRDTAFILKEAQKRKIIIEKKNRFDIDELADGKTHGGLIAYVGERTFDDLPDTGHEHCLLAIIEGIEDPFNFGQIIRTLYAAGCKGVILPPRNWSSAAKTIAKSSAGASEYIPMIIAEDMNKLCAELKERQFSIVCGDRKNAVSLYDYRFPNRTCIAIGGEMRGLSKSVQEYSDQNIYIPYENDFRNSLNAVSAAAVIAFEFVRQQI